MPRLKLPTKPVLICAILSPVILTSCATTIPSVAPTDKVFCGASQPIYWSKSDTDKTILAVKEHNAAWKALCQKTPKADKLPSTKPTTFADRWYGGVATVATVFR